MTTVLHVVVAGEVGGAERMLVDLASQGAQDRHSVALITPSERLRSLFRDSNMDVDDRGQAREGPLSYLVRTLGPNDVTWLTDIIRRRSVAVVHLHTFASQVLGTRAALATGAAVVRTEHSTRVYEDPSCWPFSRWSLARADAVVCISEHVSRVAVAHAPWILGRVRVVPNGVDTARFAPIAIPRNAAHPSLRFIALGRLDPRKGLDVALDALARVPHATLDIVGEGQEHAALVARAKRLGIQNRVRLRGFLSDVREAIASADVALSAARTEGLGIALLEAMAMERPVVALPTGGIPEFVTHGETGWLADQPSSEALARVMQEAASHPEEVRRRGVQARSRVITQFSLDAMRKGYEAVYRIAESDHRLRRATRDSL